MIALVVLCSVCSACARPAEREAHFLERGKKAVEKKDYPRAMLEFRNAISAVSKDAEPYYQLARVYMAVHDPKSAVTLLRKATELNPKHNEAQLWLAGILTYTANDEALKDAMARTKGVLAATPDNPQALDTLAAAEMRLGSLEAGLKHLEEAFAKAPQNVGAALNGRDDKPAQQNEEEVVDDAVLPDEHSDDEGDVAPEAPAELSWRERAESLIPGGASTGSKRADKLYGEVAPDLPTHFTAARGCVLTDMQGIEYLDCTMALGSVALGYAEPRVTAAVVEAASRGTSPDYPAGAK